MKRRNAETVFELCVARLGLMKGSRLAGFISTWAMASDEREGPITVEEYASHWKESSPATAYRRLAEFRDVFPTVDTPQLLADIAKLNDLRPSQAAQLPLRGSVDTAPAASPSGSESGRPDRPAGPRRSPLPGRNVRRSSHS